MAVQIAPNHLPMLVGAFILMLLLFLGAAQYLNKIAR